MSFSPIATDGPFQRMQTPRESSDISKGGRMYDGEDLKRKTGVNVVSSQLDFEDNGEYAAPMSTSLEDRFWSYANRWWLLEAVAWFASVLALMGIVILLHVHEGGPNPATLIKASHMTIRGHRVNLPGFLTINACLSILSTVLKGALLFPVAAALSQLKWAWFSASCPLSDFQMFDSAKGTWGSIVLLWTFKGRRLASLGAFLVLATLIVDFSIQSLVSYPLEAVLDQQVTLPRSDGYSTIPDDIQVSPQTGQAMLGAIYTGIFDFTESHQLKPNCPTGSCTWPRYKSIGVCSQCFDTTSYVVKKCVNATAAYSNSDNINAGKKELCTYSLPNGLAISEAGPELFFSMTGSTSSSIHFQSLTRGLTTLSTMNATWTEITSPTNGLTWPITAITANECALWPCHRTYSSTVKNGTFYEEILTTISVTDDSSLGALDYQVLTTTFDSIWEGNATGSGADGTVLASGPLAAFMYSLTSEQLNLAMASVATSMTSLMRRTGVLGVPPAPALGQAYKSVPFVAIKWAWIAVPSILLGLAFIFLLLTALSSAKQESKLWKGSSLAAFYHPLTSEGRERLGAAKEPRHLAMIAEDLNVRWTRTERGWRFVKDGAAAC